MILKNQAAYYKVIEQSTEENDSGIFIDFMLKIIAKIIKSNRINDTVNDTVNLIIQHLKENPEISYEQLAAKIGKSRVTVSRKISELKKAGKIKRIGADKNGYWLVEEETDTI